LRGTLTFFEKYFIVLGIPGQASGRFMIGFYLLPATSLWAFNPFFPLNEVQALIGSLLLENPKDEETKGKT
jgi:hypothetical protein